MNEDEDNYVLPRELEQDSLAEGFQGQTGKGAIGEKRAAEAIESYLDQQGANPISLRPDKHVNEEGPDSAFLVDGSKIFINENKDYAYLSSSVYMGDDEILDSNKNKIDDYFSQALNEVRQLDDVYGEDVAVTEPLVERESRYARTETDYSYEMPDPSFYNSQDDSLEEDDDDSANLLDASPVNYWEAQADELISELKAQRDDKQLQIYATSTDAPLSPAQTEIIESQDVLVTHVSLPVEKSTQTMDALDSNAESVDAATSDIALLSRNATDAGLLVSGPLNALDTTARDDATRDSADLLVSVPFVLDVDGPDGFLSNVRDSEKAKLQAQESLEVDAPDALMSSTAIQGEAESHVSESLDFDTLGTLSNNAVTFETEPDTVSNQETDSPDTGEPDYVIEQNATEAEFLTSETTDVDAQDNISNDTLIDAQERSEEEIMLVSDSSIALADTNSFDASTANVADTSSVDSGMDSSSSADSSTAASADGGSSSMGDSADGGVGSADGGASGTDGGAGNADGGASSADGGASGADGGASGADGGSGGAGGADGGAGGGAGGADGGSGGSGY